MLVIIPQQQLAYFFLWENLNNIIRTIMVILYHQLKSTVSNRPTKGSVHLFSSASTFFPLHFFLLMACLLTFIYSLSLKLIVQTNVCALSTLILNEDWLLAHYSMILCDPKWWYFLPSYHHSVIGSFIICVIVSCTLIFSHTSVW